LALLGGGFTLVDPDVAARLRGFRLYAMAAGYVMVYEPGAGSGRDLALHRLVAGLPGRDVHHANANRRDNRRANLRAVTRGEHLLWEPTHRGVWLGVHWAPWARLYRVHFKVARRRREAGYFRSPYLAALARDDLALRLTGGRVALNFPARLRASRLRGWLERRRGDFRVVFVPRGGGPVRAMHARRPLPLELAARPPRPDLRAQRLVSVIDVDVNEYRFIPLEGVLCVQAKGIWWRIDRGSPTRNGALGDPCQRHARQPRGSTGSATSSVPTAASTV
jgi:hypothetical protein